MSTTAITPRPAPATETPPRTDAWGHAFKVERVQRRSCREVP